MLVEDARYGEVVAIVLAVAGAVGFFVFLRRNILIAAVFVCLGAAALVAPQLIRAWPFDVIVITGQPEPDRFLTKSAFYNGVYQSASGRERKLVRDNDWPRVATVIVNDSDRLVTVRRFFYTAAGIGHGETPLMAAVFPGDQYVMRGRVSRTAKQGAPPPKTITSASTADRIDILYVGNEPYSAKMHGSREKLLDEIAR